MLQCRYSPETSREQPISSKKARKAPTSASITETHFTILSEKFSVYEPWPINRVILKDRQPQPLILALHSSPVRIIHDAIINKQLCHDV